MTKAIPRFIKRPIKAGLQRYLLPLAVRYSEGDTLDWVYRRFGIGNYESPELTGEKTLLELALPRLLNVPEPVLFDVGANSGEYSEALFRSFPDARLYAFEPVSTSFNLLQSRLRDTRGNCYRIGLSDSTTNAIIYDYEDIEGSQHASLFEDVLTKLHHSAGVKAERIELTTLDEFCSRSSVQQIDFLKIDTEGNELKVLQGARDLLARGLIRLVQFEFNEMNVIARVFLRDFYDSLRGFDFYRLMPNGLLPLGAYSPRHEVFAFQNLLAIKQGEFDSDAVGSLISWPR
jgi:FkbM family methyltransferase